MFTRRQILFGSLALPAMPLLAKPEPSSLPENWDLGPMDADLMHKMGWIVEHTPRQQPQLHVLCGPPGSGRSFAAYNIAYQNVALARRVVMFTDDPIYTEVGNGTFIGRNKTHMSQGRLCGPIPDTLMINPLGLVWNYRSPALKGATNKVLDFSQINPKPDLIIWDRLEPVPESLYHQRFATNTSILIITRRWLYQEPGVGIWEVARTVEPKHDSLRRGYNQFHLLASADTYTDMKLEYVNGRDCFYLNQIKRRDGDPVYAFGDWVYGKDGYSQPVRIMKARCLAGSFGEIHHFDAAPRWP